MAKRIPITRNFNNDVVIGEMYLADGVDIPIDHIFSIGGIIKKTHKEGDKEVIDEFELTEISLIPWQNYKGEK